jgi:hypothetical protein
MNRRKRDQAAPPLPTPEDEELRFAMQRAWAVLDSDTLENKEVCMWMYTDGMDLDLICGTLGCQYSTNGCSI